MRKDTNILKDKYNKAPPRKKTNQCQCPRGHWLSSTSQSSTRGTLFCNECNVDYHPESLTSAEDLV